MDDNLCIPCNVKDVTEHALFCPNMKDDWGVTSAATHFEKLVFPHLTRQQTASYRNDPTSRLSIILHAVDYIELNCQDTVELEDKGEEIEQLELPTKEVLKEITRSQRKLIHSLIVRWRHNGYSNTRGPTRGDGTRPEDDQVGTGEDNQRGGIPGTIGEDPEINKGNNNY